MKRYWSLLAAGALALALVACGGGDDDDGGASSQDSPATATKLALDTAYGTSGIASVPLSASAHDRFMATTVGADGKTYAAGFVTQDGDQSLAVARLDATGKLDTSFGTGGIASVNAAAGGKTVELARSVVVQSNGKIVVAGPIEHDVTATGDAARDTDVAVARFDTAGKLDPTFGTNGVAKIDLGAGRITQGTTFVGDNAWGMGNLPGDKIVVFGSKLNDGPAFRTDSDFVVFGLTSTGALDTAFGQGGKVIVDQGESADNPRNVLVQPDGKIVATGYSNVGGVVSPVIIRLSSAGVLDSSFGRNGVATAQVLPGVAESYALSLQGNNYVMAGYGRGADTTEKVDLIVYRFTANGTWDSSFGTAGLTRIDIAKEDDRARNVIVLPDEKILAVGSGKRTATDIDGMVVLLNKDGSLDTSFGEGGKLISNLGGPADAWYGVALSPDKKHVVVTGYKGTDANSGGNDDAVAARFTL
jgi:uncharacterized delta-60 repeat protein